MIGETIGQYHIIDKIGEGGMGSVWKAEDSTLGRLVALKTLSPHLAGNEEARERFVREARAASSLNHPNITVVHELVRDGDSQLICMEYVEGKTIRDMLEDGRVSVKKAISITLQVVEALEVAHRKEILHRDIKSANIMVTMEGRVKVMDFGLAHLGERSQLTRTGTMMGTLAYTSPEQIAGRPYDARSEIWSLGVVFYEMLTGHIPFKASNEAELIFGIINNEPTPVSEIRKEVGNLIEGVVNRMLEKDPLYRYQSMGELAGDLTALHRDLETGSTSALRAFDHIRQRRRKKIRTRLVVAVPTILVAAIAIVLLSRASISFRSSQPPASRLTVVAPLENETGNESLDHLSASLAGALVSALDRSGVVDDVIPPDVAMRTYREIEISTRRREREDPVRSLALSVEAGLAISGSFRRVNSDQIEVHLLIRNVGNLDVLGLGAQISLNAVLGNPQELAELSRRLGDHLVGALSYYLDERLRFYTGEMPPPTSYEAYRLLKDGVDYSDPQLCIQAAQQDPHYLNPLLWALDSRINVDEDKLTMALEDSIRNVLQTASDQGRLSPIEQLMLHQVDLTTPSQWYLNTREIAEFAPWSAWNSKAGFQGTMAYYLEDGTDRLRTALTTVMNYPGIFSTDPTRRAARWISGTTLSDCSWALFALGQYGDALSLAREYRSRAATSTMDSLYADILEIEALVLGGEIESGMELLRTHQEQRTYPQFEWYMVLRDLPLMLRKVGADQALIDEVLGYGLDHLESEERRKSVYLASTRASLYYICGHFEQARSLLSDCLKSSSITSDRRRTILHLLACCAARLDDPESARDYFQQYTATSSGSAYALLRQAQFYAVVGETDDALRLLEQALEGGALYPGFYMPWGIVLFNLESLQDDPVYQSLMRPKK